MSLLNSFVFASGQADIFLQQNHSIAINLTFIGIDIKLNVTSELNLTKNSKIKMIKQQVQSTILRVFSRLGTSKYQEPRKVADIVTTILAGRTILNLS